ncbi:hypothetical protein FHG87_016959 [Trinorchestia longiramus]|nr:hypothetical protein FHG87_016959 [Trinorchestia longiramus]
MFFCILVALPAVFCMPEAYMNPMMARKFMERSFRTSPSDEALLSRGSYNSFEQVPALLIFEDGTSDEAEASLSPHHRVRRQSAAMDLALNHDDSNGRPRPVARLHGYADANVVGNNRNNYHANMGAGVGTVAWRSRNGRHSVGVGATVDHYRGRYNGHGYRSRPSFGVGIGYRLRF